MMTMMMIFRSCQLSTTTRRGKGGLRVGISQDLRGQCQGVRAEPRLYISTNPSSSLLSSSPHPILLLQRQQQQRRFFSDEPSNHNCVTTRPWRTFGGLDSYTPAKYKIQTFNSISPLGLARFPGEHYHILSYSTSSASTTASSSAHAILLRSHKLQMHEVSPSVQAIARCGAGTNNIPVDQMTELGIPVFNTPGANANAVKELILCGLLLGSRRIIHGIQHMKQLGEQGLAKERVEKDKAMFGGREIKNKTLAIIGLGHIGAATARDAHELGMKLQGYDPGLNVQSALKLPRNLMLCDSLVSAIHNADYISLNIPYVKGPGGTHGIINAEVIQHMKRDAVFLNFARGELVDSHAIKQHFDDASEHEKGGRYITDFPDDVLWNHPNAIVLPHLGASTNEAEDSAASMAADTIRDFLEHGTIVNSVNFPSVSLPDRPDQSIRFTVVNRNQPGMLSKITDQFASEALNIIQQINQSKGSIAYNVLDVETASSDDDVLRFKKVQERITMLDGVLSSRIIYGWPGSVYAKNVQGTYWR